MDSADGFIVATWEEPRSRRRHEPRIFATGRLGDARSFAVVLPAPSPSIYVDPKDADRALSTLEDLRQSRADPVPWTDMGGTPLTRIELAPGALDKAERELTRRRIGVRGRERVRASNALLRFGITGPVAIRGEWVAGRRVDRVYVEPALGPSPNLVPLKWLALDIETDRAGAIVAVSLACAGSPGEVLYLGEELHIFGVTCLATEKLLLAALRERILARDPDVLTGWNVVEFDLRVLAQRFAVWSLPFDIGRTREDAWVREREGRRVLAQIPGRAVIDALRLVRASGERYEDQTLDTVAVQVLGEGKTVSLRGRAKLDELERLRREEPERFCSYCLRDSELVLRILAKTGLDALTAKRAALTGVVLDLAWTSIPAFERIYLAELRARHVVAPERAATRVVGAPGGTVLDATPGLFNNVVVFDFRSLYPSLMRTFNIDPLAHARAQAHPRDDDLVAPNGARFERAEGILPGVIRHYSREREGSLASGDQTAAYVYKILQNSFYGVLGADGCRYADSALVGAITAFGKLFLTTARDWFAERGHRVLYGDTDSLFVLAPFDGDPDVQTLQRFGAGAADELNIHLAERILREYRCPSWLRIRCEKTYRRFLIPRLKSQGIGDMRGRAKGYAGLKLNPTGDAEIEVRGMEAVRTDVTPLARRFQLELLNRVFSGAGPAETAAYCRGLADQLMRGELDGELVYRKSLRRPATEYRSATPPVRAARLLGWAAEKGRVSYVMSTAGAEPIEARSAAPIDHIHYLEHQILPIASAVADVVGANADAWFGRASQLPLFAPKPGADPDTGRG